MGSDAFRARVRRVDPGAYEHSGSQSALASSAGMRLGYACSWWRPEVTTWSGCSAGMLGGLFEQPDVDVVRLNAQRNLVSGSTLVALGKARGLGLWKDQRLNRRLTDRRVRRGLAGKNLDAVLAVADVQPILEVPTFLFQDGSYSIKRAYRQLLLEHAPQLYRHPPGLVDELISEQRAAYSNATTVLTYSHWFARWLVEHDGLHPDQVLSIGGGLNAPPTVTRPDNLGAPGEHRATKVLFVGREFHRKGGEVVLAGIERLRDSGSGDFRLTVVGPAEWPMPSRPPEWVDFRGELPAAKLGPLWASHDVFAMPSWFEPYGLAPLEARAAGVPCLVRDAFCMPEVVPADAGRLIPADGGADEFAEQLWLLSRDEDVYARVAASRKAVFAENNWASVAERAVGHISDKLRGP